MNQPRPTIAIILPAYNEGLTIGPTIESFWRIIPSAEIIVINNNSSDATEKVAQDTMNTLGAHGRVINEKRQGKGNAIRRAFSEIEADIYVMADADLTYPADKVGELIQPIINGEADMVVGDRLSEGHYARENKRRFHGFGNYLVKGLINCLFGSRLNDIMSGYRAFNRKFIKNYPVLVEGFQLETDVTLHALDKRFRILEIPIPYKDRPAGSFSKLNTFRDGARVIFTIAQILRYYRPMAFFGTLALIFAVAGIIAAMPVFIDWIAHRYIYHVPLAVLAAALEIVAVMSLGVGLILDSITHQHRMNAERRLLDD
ncbi:Glycosyl transferase [Candidatus Nitrotoga sp. HW29]|uniref:glycosyltransferase n=1 Tax=Candidatus Nitrotoga sp. HW29 TaxID=2886963 RepID=UPI001EF2DBF4|nr:glycosyltransferase [Candidatus Nitrotoga sp. HW29]CAH1904840.1 Glycosyl transferase [Candidatus Nitrotoga sp. HW29]